MNWRPGALNPNCCVYMFRSHSPAGRQALGCLPTPSSWLRSLAPRCFGSRPGFITTGHCGSTRAAAMQTTGSPISSLTVSHMKTVYSPKPSLPVQPRKQSTACSNRRPQMPSILARASPEGGWSPRRGHRIGQPSAPARGRRRRQWQLAGRANAPRRQALLGVSCWASARHAVPPAAAGHWTDAAGRVEMWRGGSRSGLSVAAPFVWRCPSNLAVAPFPHPAHRTGHADLPHPALGQDLTPSPTCGRGRAKSAVRVPFGRRGSRVDSPRLVVGAS